MKTFTDWEAYLSGDAIECSEIIDVGNTNECHHSLPEGYVYTHLTDYGNIEGSSIYDSFPRLIVRQEHTACQLFTAELPFTVNFSIYELGILGRKLQNLNRR